MIMLESTECMEKGHPLGQSPGSPADSDSKGTAADAMSSGQFLVL